MMRMAMTRVFTLSTSRQAVRKTDRLSECFRQSALIAMIAMTLGMSPAPADACGRRCSKVVTFYFGVETQIPDPNHPYTVDIFHTDIDVPYLSNVWQMYVSHDDVPGGTDIPPEQALIYVNEHARIQLPSIPSGYEFIGAEANATFWILPQTPDPSILYFGFAAETMTPSDHARICTWNPGDPSRGADVDAKWLQVNLIDVRGPAGGHFSVWQQGVFSQPLMFFSTHDGGITAEGDVYYILAGGHAHMNWAFTRPGLYEVDLQVSSYTTNVPGDLDDDQDVDVIDSTIFVAVLLGTDTLEEHVAAADLNCDGLVDGVDVQSFVDALIGM